MIFLVFRLDLWRRRLSPRRLFVCLNLSRRRRSNPLRGRDCHQAVTGGALTLPMNTLKQARWAEWSIPMDEYLEDQLEEKLWLESLDDLDDDVADDGVEL